MSTSAMAIPPDQGITVISTAMDKFSRPGAWFWLLCMAGLAVRLYFAAATRGTNDAGIWTEHAAGVNLQGLIGHYEQDWMMNHPPFIAVVMAKLHAVADRCGIEFRVLYRSLFSLVDLLNSWLLLRILAAYPWRFLAAGLYAVSPAALVLTGMHGNTDVLVATCLLVTCLAVGAHRPLLAGLCIGIGAWIKIPALFVAPAFGFAFPRWRDRFSCAAVAFAVAASTYLPVLAGHSDLLKERIFGYLDLGLQGLVHSPVRRQHAGLARFRALVPRRELLGRPPAAVAIRFPAPASERRCARARRYRGRQLRDLLRVHRDLDVSILRLVDALLVRRRHALRSRRQFARRRLHLLALCVHLR
jgi:hypothetical protein